jgi:hypothetical protein
MTQLQESKNFEAHEYFYRIRSLRSLLGPDDGENDGFNELRKQTIFFAAPSDLNDPMEGLKDIFWRGDKIAWENLLKHYLMCLEMVTTICIISGDAYSVDQSQIPIFLTKEDFPTPKVLELHKAIVERFFAEEFVADYADGLASRTNPIRVDELSLHLNMLHGRALRAIHDIYTANNLMQRWPDAAFNNTPPATALYEHLNRLEQEHPDIPDGVEVFMAAQEHIMDQIKAIGRLRIPNGSILHENQLFLVTEFPRAYLNRLQDLLYPDWYTACFSKQVDNPSFWGHYGQGHTGVCLKFRARPVHDKYTLPITLQNGWSSGPNGTEEKILSKVDLPLYKITYTHTHPPIDFFRSIGRLPIPKLNSTWYFSDLKEKSSSHDDVFGAENDWRQSYWERFYDTVTIKADDWSYEEEYRLIIQSQLVDYTSAENRALEYDFDALDGIIFGIKTPPDKVLAIIRVITEKCRAVGRDSFNFYQASYNKKTGKIDARHMGLVKFDFRTAQ